MTPDIQSLDAEVRDRLKRLLEEQAMVSAGQLVIVGLDPIRDKLGKGWPRYRDRVHAQFDKVVSTVLAPSEVSLRVSDDKYVVVFRGRDQAAARVVCEKILGQVHETFLGSPDMGGLSLESIVMTLDPQSFAQSMGMTLAGEGAPASPMNAGKDADSGPGRAARARQIQKISAEDIQKQDVWYLPSWDIKNQLVYSFVPTVIRTIGRRRVSGYNVLEDPRNPRQIRSLDLYLVERALADLAAIHKEGGKTVLVLPISYETLDNNESRSRFHRLCVSVAPVVRQRLIFLFTGLAPGRPPWRMAEFVTMLSQLGRVVFARIDPRWGDLGRIGKLPFRGVTVDVEHDHRPHDKVAKDLSRIKAFCGEHRMVMGIGGVHSLDLANVAQGVGVQFISGHYILGAVDKPRSALTLDWMDMYSMLADAGNDPTRRQQSTA